MFDLPVTKRANVLSLQQKFRCWDTIFFNQWNFVTNTAVNSVPCIDT